jgi:hypothetical protein
MIVSLNALIPENSATQRYRMEKAQANNELGTYIAMGNVAAGDIKELPTE